MLTPSLSLRVIRHFYHDQQGTFTVLFVLMSSLFISITVFAIEGPRYILERARLSDAMEQAALALATEEKIQTDPRNAALSKAYFQAYMRHKSNIYTPEISVSRAESSTNIFYVEYRVSAQLTQQSWLSSLMYPSFSQTVTIGGNGAARKFRSNMDVMFVLDLSGSMSHPISNDTKIGALKKTVLKIAEQILKENDVGNHVGIVPFNWGSQDSDGNCLLPFATTIPINDSTISNLSYYTNPIAIMKEILSKIDIQATIDSIPYAPAREKNINIRSNKLSISTCLQDNDASIIPLTQDFKKFEAIQKMKPSGSTLISSGILLGTQYLALGKSSRKILVIVSDGKDQPLSYYMNITNDLLKANLCGKIRSAITTKDAIGRIVFIGIKYEPNIDWRSLCVKKENFFLPNTIDQLTDALHRAVSEEIGHNIHSS